MKKVENFEFEFFPDVGNSDVFPYIIIYHFGQIFPFSLFPLCSFLVEDAQTLYKARGRVVREHEGWVRNVALIKCTLGPGKPKKGWNFGGEGTGAR
jgi:hypothetical protein